MGGIEHGTTGERGTTVVELTVAVAIVSTVFAVLMPLFAGIRNSADARWAGLEMVQNARVLNEHLCRYLAQARRVAAVGAVTEDRGWIEFEGGDGRMYRCAMRGDDCIGFGPIGDARGETNPTHESSPLGMLAGPVEYFRFACYRGDDFRNPTQDVAGARLVTWEAGLRSAGRLMQGKVITGACCLRLVPPADDCSADNGTSTVMP